MNNETAMDILREFVADVMAAHGNDINEACDTLARDWPDLAVTFRRAFAAVEAED